MAKEFIAVYAIFLVADVLKEFVLAKLKSSRDAGWLPSSADPTCLLFFAVA